jgi:hypothetical protein
LLLLMLLQQRTVHTSCNNQTLQEFSRVNSLAKKLFLFRFVESKGLFFAFSTPEEKTTQKELGLKTPQNKTTITR